VSPALRAVPRRSGPAVSVGQARARVGGAEIAVPASAANLGPGFDTVAVALQLYLRVRVCDVSDSKVNGLTFDHCGSALTGDNLIEHAFRDMAEQEDMEFPSLSLEVRTEIPIRGGLGSSAAATVAGLRLYEQLTGSRPHRDLLSIATRLDQHADNVSAALLGGLTISCVTDERKVISRVIRWPEQLQFVVAMPTLEVPTAESRKVLPDEYSRSDAVFNLQRALLLVYALQHGQLDIVREVMRDRWHQPYRALLVPGLVDALALEHPKLVGVCLSGSGPAILALASGAFTEIEQLLGNIYARLNVPCAVRTIAAHQPGAAS
jgi:homoserine kinase